MKRVSFKEATAALKKLNMDDVLALAETMVIYDETSGIEGQAQMSLAYGFIKEPVGEKCKKAAPGSLVVPDVGDIGNGETDLEYHEGMPGIMLYSYRVKVLGDSKEEADQMSDCGTPVISFKTSDGKARFLGEEGYNLGACRECPFGKIGGYEGRTCMPQTKFVMLTVYPDAEGKYVPLLIQFKGKGMRATPLKNSLTRLTTETKGIKYNKILKIGTTEGEPFTVTEGGKDLKKTIFVYTFSVEHSLPEDADFREAQGTLRTSIAEYLADQHEYRKVIYAEMKLNMPSKASGYLPGAEEVAQIEGPSDEVVDVNPVEDDGEILL